MLGGDGAHLRLVDVAEREAQPRERGARQPGEHVGLILGGVGRQAQQAVGRLPRVVPGGQRRGAEAVGEGEHGVQADVAVAAHARVGREAGGVLGQPGLHHAGAELVAQVEAEVCQAHPVGDRARDAHRVGRAARAIGIVGGIAPQLEGHCRRVRAAAQGGDGRVDAAAHGHQRALGIDGGGAVGGHRPPQGARERVGGELGRVELPGTQSAQRVGDGVRADARRLEDARPAHELDGGAARGDGRAAARRLEAGVGHAVAVDGDADAHEIAARGAAGRAVMDGDAAAADRVQEVLFEALVGHPASVGRALGAIRPRRSSRARAASWRRRRRRCCRRSRAARA